ncbi:MAG: MerR family transcriptional regulator [Shewanella sp.]|nr:MerR family transcriptional regulator [Shewanella sp.]MCF1429885.1 MerR family transcriptional regulator [Shewanella sp.]MCF1457792.1 MerR family transcriptional regulator [Shewanella sp.]
MDTESKFTIGDVARMTGVNPVTLRAWQRRFGLLTPKRTPKGHRLYSDADVQRIEAILGWLAKGVAISKVKPLLSGDVPMKVSQQDEWQSHIQRLNTAVFELNGTQLHSALDEISALYPSKVLLRHLLVPWLEQTEPVLSERQDGELLTQWLRGLLWQRLAAMQMVRRGTVNSRVVLLTPCKDYEPAILAGFELALQNISWWLLSLSAAEQLPLVAERMALDYLVLAAPASMTTAQQQVLYQTADAMKLPFVCYGQFASLYTHLSGWQIVSSGELMAARIWTGDN